MLGHITHAGTIYGYIVNGATNIFGLWRA
jgi:hypothetical protein